MLERLMTSQKQIVTEIQIIFPTDKQIFVTAKEIFTPDEFYNNLKTLLPSIPTYEHIIALSQ